MTGGTLLGGDDDDDDDIIQLYAIACREVKS